MSSDTYWANRMRVLEESLLDIGYEYMENLEQQYNTAVQEIEKQIASWYQRFAQNNGLTLAEAKRLLNTREMEEFRWTVEEYIKYGRENVLSGEWIKQLENASARVHISRLDSLKLQLQQQAEKLAGNQLDAVDTAARRIYESGYYHTAFEVQKGLGVGWALRGLDERSVRKVLSRPWTLDGQTFSDRIWTNKRGLINSVSTQLTQMIMRGEAPDRAIKVISERFNVSKLQAGRLIMTESAAFSNEAHKDCFNDLDVEKYSIIEALDKETCSLCRALDGKVYPMSEYEIGVTAPPFHPWCRGTTAPHFADMEDIGVRAARDDEGKYYDVPRNMTYREWANHQSEMLRDTQEGDIIMPDAASLLGDDDPFAEDMSTEQRDHVVVQGQDLTGEYTLSGDFEHPIEDVIHAQGFDGPARVVSREDFEKATNESGFYGERAYCAPDRDTLEQWRQELYDGKWYVDCSTGGAQYGQGMYCAGCYDITDNKSIEGIGVEMSHYRELGAQRGNSFAYVESITMDKSARILTLPRGAKAEEYISDVYMNAYLRKFAPVEKLRLVDDYISVRAEISKLTYKEDQGFIDELYDRRNELSDQLRPWLKQGIDAQMYTTATGRHVMKDPGVRAAEMGYDAINAVGHGESGSYTVILNRTKVIFCEGGSIYGN